MGWVDELIHCCQALIFYFFRSQIKAWTANPQQFVEDEDDDTFSYSVRISAQDLLLVRENLPHSNSAYSLIHIHIYEFNKFFQGW